MFKKSILTVILLLILNSTEAQKLRPFKLPETGQNTSFTTTYGEDADFIINPMSFTDNGNGTITDNNTGLIWQKADGGEMTIENAVSYCNNLTLAGSTGWRLPTAIELFSINNHNRLNPAIDTFYFTKTLAEYWWSSDKRADDTTAIWAVNSGGGIGAHPKSETQSAGGTKKIHVRAVKNPITTSFSVPHFTDNGNNTVTDNYTGLIWQKIVSVTTFTWEQALTYADTISLAGKSDWRLPNIKELQTLNMVNKINPSFDNTVFSGLTIANYWSSTTMTNTITKAWDINLQYGIVSYNDKTLSEHILLVRGGNTINDLNFQETIIPADTFSMGDHFGFVDPGHPSDETPIHSVKVDSFYMSKYETTNQQFLDFLNSYLLSGQIQVQNNKVYLTGDTNILCYTNQFASYYSISYNGGIFSMADFRANHPMVGVMWYGAIAFCNWMSVKNGYQSCYTLQTGACNFAKNGYRLPTEAEWEWAGRGGHTHPYLKYCLADTIDRKCTNLPNSGDPYESTNVALYPLTTPVGFYNGSLKQKTDYNWPGTASTYQTTNGINGFGLYDMQGNVWEMLNDWYGQNYYSLSPYNNPTGPTSGFIMPDGKPYRGMRGGNWYNGLDSNGVNDGHSRVSNRNPTYYRGPQDPNHPWYHIGFRIVRKYIPGSVGIINYQNSNANDFELKNYPNPAKEITTIVFALQQEENVSLKIYNAYGQLMETLVYGRLSKGEHCFQWHTSPYQNGLYTYTLHVDNRSLTRKIIILK
jgi:formylglycine-generating enzyme required for sulfatase activity